MQAQEKWFYERKVIENVLDVILEDQIFTLRKGEENHLEPDGIVVFKNETYGIEVTDFHSGSNLKRDAAAKKIAKKLKEKLDCLVPKYELSFDGNKIPIGNKEIEKFVIIAERRLRELIPNLVESTFFEIENVPIQIRLSTNEEFGVSYNYSYDINAFSYQDDILHAIKSKNKKKYSTDQTILILNEKSVLSYFECDFKILFEELSKESINFSEIFVIPNTISPNFLNPRLIQVYPDIRYLLKKGDQESFEKSQDKIRKIMQSFISK